MLPTLFTYTEITYPDGSKSGPEGLLSSGDVAGRSWSGSLYGYTYTIGLDKLAAFDAQPASLHSFPFLPEEKFIYTIAGGFNAGWATLGIQDADLARWAQLLTLLNESERMGLITTSSMTAIADISGSMHTKSVNDIRQALVGAGFYWNTAWAESKVSGSYVNL